MKGSVPPRGAGTPRCRHGMAAGPSRVVCREVAMSPEEARVPTASAEHLHEEGLRCPIFPVAVRETVKRQGQASVGGSTNF